MLIVLGVAVALVVSASVRSARARWAPGVAATLLSIYLLIATMLAELPRRVSIPLGTTLASLWWLTPAAITSLAVAAAVLATRRVSRLAATDVRVEQMERVASTFVTLASLAAALFVILAIATYLASRDVF